jgi:hypothetical protein
MKLDLPKIPVGPVVIGLAVAVLVIPLALVCGYNAKASNEEPQL